MIPTQVISLFYYIHLTYSYTDARFSREWRHYLYYTGASGLSIIRRWAVYKVSLPTKPASYTLNLIFSLLQPVFSPQCGHSTCSPSILDITMERNSPKSIGIFSHSLQLRHLICNFFTLDIFFSRLFTGRFCNNFLQCTSWILQGDVTYITITNGRF